MRFLKQEFNITPHVAWQLDPFGYSSVTPNVFSQYGYDTLFITRVSTHIKKDLREKGDL